MVNVLEAPPEIKATQEARSDLAFLIPPSPEDELAFLRRDIVNSTYLLRQALPEGIKEAVRQELAEYTDKLSTTLRTAGAIVLSVPERLMRFTRTERLLGEYSLGATIHNEQTVQLLYVPASNITGSKSQPKFSRDGFAEPVLWTRIQTPDDKPLSYHAGPGKIEQATSLGQWHSFPLEFVGLATVLPTMPNIELV